MMMTSRIRNAREDRGWSQTRLIGELERIAARRGQALPSRETLKSRVSRWENGRARPDDFYRRLLREAFGLDDAELGFTRDLDETALPAADELRARLATGARPDAALLESLRAQTDAIRQQDRQYGAGALLEQMRGHVANIEQHLAHSVFDTVRRPLARLLADAAALAGWQALDLAAVDQAWRYFEMATSAGQEARDPALLAFARVEQAHVLVDLGQADVAAQLTRSVWDQAHGEVARGVQCWLAAAAGEMYAGAGEHAESRSMLSTAESVANGLEADLPPYLVFNGTHLDRWIGHSLVLLDDSAAEQPLRRAAADMDPSFTRAEAALRVDLACTLRSRGEREEAAEHLRRAEMLATRVGSRRQFERVRRLRGAS